MKGRDVDTKSEEFDNRVKGAVIRLHPGWRREVWGADSAIVKYLCF